MPYYADGLSGRGLMTSLEEGKDRSFNKIIQNWVMNCTCIVDNWHISNAVITLATVLATIPVLSFCQYAQVPRTGAFFMLQVQT